MSWDDIKAVIGILAIPFVPLIAWIINVERRISSLQVIFQNVTRIETKLDRLDDKQDKQLEMLLDIRRRES
jgi:hypothetical protein